MPSISSPSPSKPPTCTAAIIGISNYGRQHLLMAAEQMLHGRIRLVAATVVNRSEERVFCERLERLGCTIFEKTEDMWAACAGQVDVCFIPTGIHLHAAMVAQALLAGAAVLVEKPLAPTMAQAREIRRLEKETGRFVAVGFQDLYAESTWQIKKLILEGRLGELQSASFIGLWPRGSRYYARNNWAGCLEKDGWKVFDSPVSNAFGHFLNLALFWSGPDLPTSASVRSLECELYRTRPIESFDTCCARAALSGGCELRFYLSHSCSEERPARLVLRGSKASLIWVQESHYEIVDHDGTLERHSIPGKFENKFMMADAVTARLAGDAALICSTGIALEHTRLVEAMHAASPIRNIPDAGLRWVQAPTGDSPQILGIDEYCEEADRRGRLWSEIGVPWAQLPESYTVPPDPS